VADLRFREASTMRFRDPTTGRFVPNPLVVPQLAAGLAMKAAVHLEAVKVADAAKQLARAEAYDTGAYERGIRPASGLDKDPTVGYPLQIGRVNAWDFKSGWIEFGSIHNVAKHILQRAAEAVGYTVQVSQNFRRVTGSGRERVSHLKR